MPARIQNQLQQVQNLYGENYFALGYLTVVDFIFAEDSYYIEAISKELYSKMPFLQRVREAVESLPEVQEYYQR